MRTAIPPQLRPVLELAIPLTPFQEQPGRPLGSGAAPLSRPVALLPA